MCSRCPVAAFGHSFVRLFVQSDIVTMISQRVAEQFLTKLTGNNP